MAQRKPPHAMEVRGPPARRRPGPSLVKKACRAALGGGAPGAAAMVLQVLLLMWLRTTINVQLATGSGFLATMRHLYREGGVPRFYQGLWIALLSAPLARFGDTAANEGALALLEASAAVWKSTSASGASRTRRPGSVERQGTGIATPSSRRRVDGVEVDATIQHERAVKF